MKRVLLIIAKFWHIVVLLAFAIPIIAIFINWNQYQFTERIILIVGMLFGINFGCILYEIQENEEVFRKNRIRIFILSREIVWKRIISSIVLIVLLVIFAPMNLSIFVMACFVFINNVMDELAPKITKKYKKMLE